MDKTMQKLQHIGSIKDLRKIEQENTGKGSEEGGRKVRICPLLSSSFFLSSTSSPTAVSIYQFAFYLVDFELY